MLRTTLRSSRLMQRYPIHHPQRVLSSAFTSAANFDQNRRVTDYTSYYQQWPIPQVNTILNVCPEGERMIVERLGSLHHVYEPGWFVSIPVIDQIAYRIDMRERTLPYPPQIAVTKDNVTVKVDAVIFVQFTDPLKAAYGATDPLTAVKELAKSAMRAAVGELELDAVFHSRQALNETVCDAVSEAAANWGLLVTRHEILDVSPDKHICEAMDKQAAAERMRREKVLEAEGQKQAAKLESEGIKIKLTNESEGHLIRVRNEAMAEQTKLELEAEGKAKATISEAEAQRQALQTVAKALIEMGGDEAARLEVAKQYIKMYGEMAKTSNTIMMTEKAGDVASLMSQAGIALETTKSALTEISSQSK